MFCYIKGRKSVEEHFPQTNWVVVLLLQLLNGTALSLVTPSIYQFVTTPSTPPEEFECDKNGTRFWGGLGGSDTDYALALVSYPIFETAAMPLAGAMLHHLPFTVTIYLFLTIFIIGGIVYAFASTVWMVFIGYGLFGAGASFGSATVHTYIGEMGTVMDKIRKSQGKKPRKFALYIAYSFLLTGGVAVPFAITSIMAQFDIDPYRWPGWMQAALASVYCLLVLLCFTETRPWSCDKISCEKCSPHCGLQLSMKLQSNRKKRFLSHLFLIACAFIVGQVYAALSTLVPPVLGDQFGFNVKYRSYFLFGLSAAYILSSIIQLGAKLAKMNNRYLLALSLIFTLVGSALACDWQSIGHDPCLSFNIYTTTTNSSTSEDPCSEHLNSSIIQQLVDMCKNHSSPGHDCFWNRQSRITGGYCYACYESCLSKRKSHNIYQFSLGALFLAMSAPLGYVFISAIGSEITSVNSQGKFVGTILGVGALARAVSPIWFVVSYEMNDRHTVIPMAITAGLALVLLIVLAALYKNLATISKQDQMDLTVNATSQLAATELYSAGLDAAAEAEQAQQHIPEDTFRETPV